MTFRSFILIVVPGDEIAGSLTHLLAGEFLEVERARTVAAARDCLSKRRPDLVLCESTLPEGSGLDVLALVRGIDTDLPVVMLTAVDDISSVLHAIRLGANDYLPHPVNRDSLRRVLGKALERQRVLRQMPGAGGAKRNVLVVDDDPVALKWMSNQMVHLGFSVLQATSLKEARALLDQPLDVLVLDGVLPDGLGVELLAEVHAKDPQLPAVIVTASAQVATAIAALRGGAFDYLSKPLDREILAAAVTRAYQHRASLKSQGRLAAEREEYWVQLEHLSDQLDAKVREQTAAVAKLQTFLMNIMESVPIGILVVDLAGRLTEINRSGCNILGRTREDLLGSSLADVPLLAAMEGPLLNAARTGASFNLLESEVTPPEGDPVILGYGVAPLRSHVDGCTTGALAQFADITAKRKTEKYLARSDKLISLGMLAGGMAHDINNPLTISLGFVDLVSSDESLPPVLSGYVDKVREGILRCGEIVRGMLGLCRMDAGQVTPVDLVVASESVISLLERQFRLSGVEVIREFSGRPVVLGSKVELEQLIFNLLTNARDACLEWVTRASVDGKGAVRPGPAGMIRVCLAESDGRVQLAVSDNGVGMRPESVQQLFTPFYTTKEVGRGTGLGLSICHSIVQRHGAQIQVASSPGLGTSFTVDFPMSLDATTAPVPEVGHPGIGGRSLRILVVDDEPDILESCRIWLERDGHIVTIRGSGPETLEEALFGPYEMVLCDLKMPRVDGLEMVRTLRRDRPGLPVVMMTGSTEAVNGRLLQENGAAAVLQKPFEPQALVSIMREVAARLLTGTMPPPATASPRR